MGERALRAAVLVGSIAMAVGVGGCVTQPVGPVADVAGYRAKAAVTVEDVRSATATAQLAGEGERDGRTFRAYAEQVADDAVATIQTAQDTFESIAPPDAASAPVRTEVLDAVAGARRAVVDVRAALQGQDDAALDRAVGGLGPVVDRLAQLDGELGS